MGDIIILAILIGLTYLGYQRGFLRTLAGVVSIALSLIIATAFSGSVANYLENSPVYDVIFENVERCVKQPGEPSNNVYDYGAAELNFPKEFIKDVQKDVTQGSNEVKTTLSYKITDMAINVLSFVIIFVIVRIAMQILLIIVGMIKKIPFIGWSDRLLGGLFGFLRGFLAIYLALALVTVVASFDSDNFLVNTVNQSEFAKVMYNNNVFLDFVYKD